MPERFALALMQPFTHSAQKPSVAMLLRPDELLVEYSLGEPSSVAVVTARRESRHFILPGASVIEQGIVGLLSAVRSGHSGAEEAENLGTILLSQIPGLSKYTRLIVSGDQIVDRVPFDVLVPSVSGRPLLNTHIVSALPSPWALLPRREQRRPTGEAKMALAVGTSADWAFGSMARIGSRDVVRARRDIAPRQLPSLASVGDEAQAVAAAFPGWSSRILIGHHATERALKSQPLNAFSLLHFATHATIDTRLGTDSALVLLPATGDDGLLQPREIVTLRVNADLVTLSACATGADVSGRQHGRTDLVRSFLVAGARAVVANLWEADDVSSLALMREFYRQLAGGEDIGESLRRSKLRLLDQFGPAAVPKFWGGLVVFGDAAVVVAPSRAGASTQPTRSGEDRSSSNK
jgi:CHAT domain-containing protein